MRIKTIVIILIAVLLTIVLMQNTGIVYFQFLWATFALSKLVMLLFVALVGFVLGVLVGRPKRVKRLGSDFTEPNSENEKTNTLSNEDKDYIN